MIGHLDRPRTWFVAPGPLDIVGWAVGDTPIRTVGVHWNGTFLGNAELNRARPDVAQAHPKYPEAGRGGFAFATETVAAGEDGAAVLQVTATTVSGNSRTFVSRLRTIKPHTGAVRLLKPDSGPAAYVGMASAFAEARCLDDAEIVLTETLRLFPSDFAALVAIASVAVEREHWQLALQRWDKVREAFPDRPAGFLGASSALVKLKRSDAAQAVLAEAERRFPADREVAVANAVLATEQGAWPTALERWQRVRADFDELPWGHVETGVALFHLNRFAEAERLLGPATERFPHDARAAIFHAMLATQRRDWTRALRRWSLARQRFPDFQDIAHLEQETKHGMWMDLDTAITDPAGAPDQAAAISIQDPKPTAGPNSDLMFRFESLGSNCDLGLVQRHFDSEPLGLLRFASIGLASLIRALRMRFADVGAPENTELAIGTAGRPEYWLSDRTHQFRMHTYIYAEHIDDEASLRSLHAKHCRRLRFLKDKLVADLESAKKILVFRAQSSSAVAEMKELHSELRRYGPNTLLWVHESEDRPSGEVELLEPGLMVGYLERDDPKIRQIPFDCWLRICAGAAMLREAGH